ncbi:MOSC domain-containing protein [Bradyrhizobium sp. LjRoot220]|uniref:MOSC domain-containing protein n=1 Tax=Bradyrhizobium sp. LjRoot220 TaxID=3342284 RepID=UPI003ECE780F
MTIVGRLESVWRYPVKSMPGESLPEAYVDFAGVLGDRLCAVHHAGAPKSFPFLTARSRKEMLRFRPKFRHPERTLAPDNLTEAETRGPGVTPLFPTSEDLALEIEAPNGKILSASDPVLPALIGGDQFNASELTMIRSDRAITDCRPLSLLAIQTIDSIGRAAGVTLDKRRFRENLYLDLNSGESFAEDAFVGRRLRIGPRLTVHILERDIRCRMINIDPESLDENPEILQHVARNHDNRAGVYAAVLVAGMVRPGDEVVLED